MQTSAMPWKGFDFSARGKGRVALFSALGTLCCIAVAFAVDGYAIETGEWRWGEQPWNNAVIPLILAPPFFVYLLTKLRELAIAHQELMVVASTDSLTACLNRRAFTALVDGYLERIAREQVSREGALLVIDVDHFKHINDEFGHDRGDEALKLIAETIKGALRDIDVVGRIGGEEFSVFLPGLNPNRTEAVAERIRAAVNAATFIADDRACKLSVSVGGTTFDREASFSDLYRRADQRLYSAKRNGRNRVEIEHLAMAGEQARIAIH
jgi:diguanylate cyclase